VKNLTVADVMTSDVLTARTAMPLKELARVLAEHHVSALPVLDVDDRVVGVVSERDVLLKQAHQIPRRPHWWEAPRRRDEIERAAGDTVGHVMTTRAVTVGPDATLAQAARLLADHDVKRLPVVDAHGTLVGIVSRGDLMKAFLRTDEQIRRDVIEEVFVHLLWADPTTVEVTVQDGIVTLAGTVEERSTAEAAERLVRRLDGVVDVIRHLEHRIDDGGLARRR
jgi:CBS domain-containing protein